MSERSSFWLAILLLAAFCASALIVRPLLPVDETRYASVAWEMRASGDWLVPHLNGAVYAQKPPLLFWLINAGWAALGVNDGWPRILSPVFSLLNLWLVWRLAKLLWPEAPRVAAMAPLFLAALPVWMFFSSLLTFDMALSFFTLLAQAGWLLAWRERRWQGLIAAALGIGGGILTKGPVILLHVMPVLFLARFWAPRGRDGSRGPIPGSAIAVACGISLALAWAIPAGIAGGAAYREQIFHGQTAGRVLNSFAHKQPWWWYLPWAPLLVFPWILTARFWRSWRVLRAGARLDQGICFCVAWAGAAFAGFSVVSGKQIYYMLPELPAIALLLARVFCEFGPQKNSADFRYRIIGVVYMLASLALLAVALSSAASSRLPPWMTEIAWPWGAAALLVSILALAGWPALWGAPHKVATATVLICIIAQAAIFHAARGALDLKPAARFMAAVEAENRPVAMVGGYQGQFNFLGRLKTPLLVIGTAPAALDWAAKHRDGVLVIICNRSARLPASELAYVQDYRGKRLACWNAARAAQDSNAFLEAFR